MPDERRTLTPERMREVLEKLNEVEAQARTLREQVTEALRRYRAQFLPERRPTSRKKR